ncbi:MAG TPA: DUF4123 domain-containing protein [Longimicrobiaceae bacterium]|nr:DUF4123 domain-containing protein [Longimicrobiaceae bacterium]
MSSEAVTGGPPEGLLATSRVELSALAGLAASGRLYAVLDACDAPAVPEKCAELGSERAVSLYRGGAEEMYWTIAPYLVAVDPTLLDWIAGELWEEPWGIFAVSDAGLEALRRHFRRFLLVRAPNGEQWYFRFYDPRVLPTFLAGCSAPEAEEFFGPVHSFGVRDADPSHVQLLSRGSGSDAPRRIRIRLRRPA